VSEPVPSKANSSGAFAEARARAASDHPVLVIVLGERHRGDDGVGFAAVEAAMNALAPQDAARVDVRETGQLDPADLVELAVDGGAVVVDAVVGVAVGEVVVLPLEVVAAAAPAPAAPPPGTPVPRSSHVLPVDQLVALAAALRGAPPRGVLVGVGCERFGFGEGLSPVVEAAVPAFAAAIRVEVERLLAVTP
jgi:hydrogenase maturation protease